MKVVINTPPLLSVAKTDYVGSKPFYGDQLDRKKLALHLTGFLERLKEGAVLAIDAPWGEGKTWFGKNWAEHLKNDAYQVIYIDAFEQDYIEDPFMLLSAEILEVMGENDLAPKLTETATNIAKALIPMGTKMIVNTIGQWALGTSNLSEKAKEFLEGAVDDSAEVSSGWIKDRLTKHAGDKALMQQFKEQLTEFANSNPERPIVIFIDELDRCKPTFAVELIERIKHFFDVPNLVFVLLLNREQLEKAVCGVYGHDTDAATYLGKFINFFFRLPKTEPTSYYAEKEMNGFVKSTFEKYRFPEHDKIVQAIDTVTFFAIQMNLSLRDIERAVALYAFAFPIGQLEQIIIYWIILKQKDFKLFNELVQGDKESHQKMLNTVERLLEIDQERSGTSFKHALNIYKEWHEAYINDFATIGEKFGRIHGLLANIEYDITPKQMLPYFAKKLDLNMEI